MRDKKEEILLLNDEVNEILSEPPKWILRWGLTIVFVFILLTLVLSYFIRYPDILSADIIVTTLHPPITLIANNNGKLTHLLVKEKEAVKSGQIIGIIENTADYTDVKLLLEMANLLADQIRTNDTISTLFIKEGLKTGEITPNYLQLLKSIKDFNLFKKINPFNRQIFLLKKDLVSYDSLLLKHKNQQIISEEQLKLAETDYYRDKRLFEEKMLSSREYETQKKNLLTVQSSNEQSRITISNTMIQINSIEKSLLQLQIQDYQEQSKLKNELLQYIKSLINEINKWKHLYIIESPVNGKVSFFNFWSINQNVKQGDELFAIVEEQKQQFIGKCILPIINSGKLTIGQKVNIKLENYPYIENGMLRGIVDNISEVPSKENYVVDISLPFGLRTSYKKVLTFKEQMRGKANIITRDISVFERLFFNFSQLFEKTD